MGKYFFVTTYENGVTLPIINDEAVSLLYQTGERVRTTLSDPMMEERPVLDEDGNETDDTYSVFVGWGPSYIVTVDEWAGGILTVKTNYEGDKNKALCLVHTSEAIRDLIDSDVDWAYVMEQ